MLRAIATTFLFVACISEIVLGNIARNGEDEVITRFDRYRRQAQAWGPGVVPTKRIDYFFKDGISQAAKDLFLKATKAWEKYTCVKFKENTTRAFFPYILASTERMLVTDEGTQCLYKRNRTGRGMKIMYVGCGYFGGAAHEVGHSLWLDHTHNRHDRDKHLDVNDKSIEQEYYRLSHKLPGVSLQVYKEQYKKLTTSENKNYDIPYDYGSIMHYGSSGPNPTMTPKDRKYHKTMGSPLISFTDLAMVNKHHNCEDSCRGKPTECANRGFPNPNNCDICVCPSGYGGDRCEDKPDKCGKVLNATEKWQTVAREIYNKKVHGDYFKCTNWIKGPKGTKIEVQILEVSRASEWYPQGCVIAGIELKTNADQRLTGYRFCSEDDVKTELKSESNLVPFITYSMHTTNWLKVKLRYRYGRSFSLDCELLQM
ncbi:hypothetical protein Y032_0003g1374 [Ancylostoma ceylanicum]|uniref:Zinc metalloproteinase n=1 Tax=Ancylostoma ceylanicum TaxID=53326 RepID=A0A016VXP3_9BILA|nr:hypothetical protein Y032_0003g1374 [Ancylostoma ceylanicum]